VGLFGMFTGACNLHSRGSHPDIDHRKGILHSAHHAREGHEDDAEEVAFGATMSMDHWHSFRPNDEFCAMGISLAWQCIARVAHKSFALVAQPGFVDGIPAMQACTSRANPV
jgi:hypothetical protein